MSCSFLSRRPSCCFLHVLDVVVTVAYESVAHESIVHESTSRFFIVLTSSRESFRDEYVRFSRRGEKENEAPRGLQYEAIFSKPTMYTPVPTACVKANERRASFAMEVSILFEKGSVAVLLDETTRVLPTAYF